MKLFFSRYTVSALLLLMLSMILTAIPGTMAAAQEKGGGHQPIVQNLIDLIDCTPSLKENIRKSLAIQEKGSQWHNRSVDDFVSFFDEWAVYAPDPACPEKYIEAFDLLANSPAGPILFNDNVFSSWFIAFLNDGGQFMNTKASAAHLDEWFAYPAVHINDYILPEVGYRTFNDFFLRRVKPEARPLGGGSDPAYVVSPADGSICQIYADNLEQNFTIKRDVINIRQALNNSPYADRFIGGPSLDILLWFTDYHRFHAPVSGKIVETGSYAGSYNYNFRDVNWYKELARHKRTCYLIESDRCGLVAMIPVGFWGVGSIVTEEKVKVGSRIEKGDEMGHFLYGGSSIVLVFEPGKVKFSLPIPKRQTGDEGLKIKVRQQIAETVR